ncbi:MAG: adenosine-specific kinase [Candidatus Delongbacteria bacterium]|jgi:adenosine/AMP kinase|nr:adenosine-specific kinase [Candidatus Delongbacteria bacterium]
MHTEIVTLDFPEDANIILGQSHFIKTIEDIYEAMVNTVPGVKFGVAFCEASGECLVRYDGNDDDLMKIAADNAFKISAGHSFIIVMRDAFPINVLGRIKDVPEVCRIFCATANPTQVIVASTQQGRGIMGVIDGFAPKGIEKEKDKQWRKDFLRNIGYKL